MVYFNQTLNLFLQLSFMLNNEVSLKQTIIKNKSGTKPPGWVQNEEQTSTRQVTNRDAWWGNPLIQNFNLQDDEELNANSTASEFIQNYHWNMPADLCENLPVLRQLVVQVIIPSKQKRDQLIWNAKTSDNLCFSIQISRAFSATTIWSKLRHSSLKNPCLSGGLCLTKFHIMIS